MLAVVVEAQELLVKEDKALQKVVMVEQEQLVILQDLV